MKIYFWTYFENEHFEKCWFLSYLHQLKKRLWKDLKWESLAKTLINYKMTDVFNYRKVANRNRGFYWIFCHKIFWKGFYSRAVTIKIPKCFQKVAKLCTFTPNMSSSAVSIQGRFLFQFATVLKACGYYSRAVSIWGRFLIETLRYVSMAKNCTNQPKTTTFKNRFS